jgi:hypothetical protein
VIGDTWKSWGLSTAVTQNRRKCHDSKGENNGCETRRPHIPQNDRNREIFSFFPARNILSKVIMLRAFHAISHPIIIRATFA